MCFVHLIVALQVSSPYVLKDANCQEYFTFLYYVVSRDITEWFQNILKTLENLNFPVLCTDITIVLYMQKISDNKKILLTFSEIRKFPEKWHLCISLCDSAFWLNSTCLVPDFLMEWGQPTLYKIHTGLLWYCRGALIVMTF